MSSQGSEQEKTPNNFIFIPELALSVSVHVTEGNISAEHSHKQSATLHELRIISTYVKAHNIPFFTERGEWTADFINYNEIPPSDIKVPNEYIYAVYIVKPESIAVESGKWKTDGGTKIPILLPPHGWIIPNVAGELFDPKTGLPFRTTSNMKEANISNYSYFWRGENGDGLLAVNRECERMQGTSFEISATQRPNFSHENIGMRQIIRR